MKAARQTTPIDLLSLVSFAAIAILVVLVFYVASSNPASRTPLTIVIVGLGAATLILFRQSRKTTNGLLMSKARAEYAATHDELTNLPNKSLFIERMNQAAGTQAGVLCIGLDRFEEINEVLGHGASDDVVAEIAARLVSICPEGDTLARIGEDGFALLWKSASARKAKAVAAEMLKLLSTPYEASTGRTFVTCSMGMSFLTSELETPIEALRQAQLALSHSRRIGGGHFSLFEPAMDQALKSRKAMEVELRNALAADELSMVYQPQVNARGVMVGVEALMRWNSPERGPVSPATFIPLAEGCGLADALGEFALRQAFIDAQRWPGLKVAVNVSAAQIRSGLLVPTLKALLKATGANPRNFELEITEGVLLADEAETLEVLATLRRLGFALALDDFGTGYSSLSYLRRFPIDKIKIDKSFIAHLGVRPESDAIVKAIVDLAEALELKVIAEGVETRAQVDRLSVAGCHHIQGYYYSKPVDADAIDELIAGRMKLAA